MITLVAVFMCCVLYADVEQCFLLCFERLDQVFNVDDASFCGCMNVVDRNATCETFKSLCLEMQVE